MNDKDFQNLVASVHQMRALMKGEDVPHRRFSYPTTDVKALRTRLELTQDEFAAMIGVSVRTLQNWEQGHRETRRPRKGVVASSRDASRCSDRALHPARSDGAA